MSDADVQLIQTRWWSLPVSDDWQIASEDGTVIITDNDEVGSLELSVIELEGGAGDIGELRALAAEFVPAGVDGVAVSCGDWRGLLFEYYADEYCRDWVLHDADQVLIISYTSAAEHRGMDDAAVDQMLAELSRGTGEAS